MINDINLEKITFNYKERLGVGYFDYTLDGIKFFVRLYKEENGIWRVNHFIHERVRLGKKCPLCEEVYSLAGQTYEYAWENSKCHGAKKYERELLDKLINEPSIRLRMLLSQIVIEPRKEHEK